MLDNVLVVGGSIVSSKSDNKRIDFLLVTGKLLLIDGREDYKRFLGQDLPEGRMVVFNLAKNLKVIEQPDGSMATEVLTA